MGKVSGLYLGSPAVPVTHPPVGTLEAPAHLTGSGRMALELGGDVSTRVTGAAANTRLGKVAEGVEPTWATGTGLSFRWLGGA